MPGIGFIRYSRKTKETIYYTAQNNVSFKGNSVYAIQKSIADKNILWLATDNGRCGRGNLVMRNVALEV